MLYEVITLVAVVLLLLPIISVIKGKKSGLKAKKAFIFNLCGFFGIMLVSIIIPLGGFVSAEAATEVVAKSTSHLGYIAAALSTGLSSLGAGIAVAAAAPAAIGAVSEEPKSFVKSLIFVALGEGRNNFV